MKRLLGIAALAAAPGLVAASGLLAREASAATLLLAIAADLALCLLVVRAGAAPRSSRAGALLDAAAWLAGAGALAVTTLFSSPFPRWLGGDGPGRRSVLALAAIVAAASAAIVHGRRPHGAGASLDPRPERH